MLIQITAPHFCAGAVLIDDIVTEAAPILKSYGFIGWDRNKVRSYCRRHNWQIKIVRFYT